VRVSSETCRAICRKYNKSCIQLHLVGQLLTIRCRHFACWITKSRDTHSEYVTRIVFHRNNVNANPTQRYVTRTIPVFFTFELSQASLSSIFVNKRACQINKQMCLPRKKRKWVIRMSRNKEVLTQRQFFDRGQSRKKMYSEKRTTGGFTEGDFNGHRPLKTFLGVITVIIILSRRASVTWISKHFFLAEMTSHS